MASKTTLNATNLEALGAARLAELLMELGAGDAALKRRLRMELLAGSPRELAKQIRKRLTTIARSRSFIDWQMAGKVANDLDTQRKAIVEKVAEDDPAEALELLWRFMALATSIFERSDDGSGAIVGVFENACEDIGKAAILTKADPIDLANRVYSALVGNDYGQYDGLIGMTAPALGQSGLEHLKKHILALSSEPVQRPPEKQRRAIGYGSGGPIYQDQIAEISRKSTVNSALKDIADALGDVDAFIERYDEHTRKVPRIAAQIAERLLAADRADEALVIINAAEHRKSDGSGWMDFVWENARIEVLEALGRADDAQKARWHCFERSLSSSHLRAYLKKLPDFEDVDAEDQALAYAEGYRSCLGALSFLVSWPALDRAARLVIAHAGDLDGNHYEILTRAADALAAKHPLAATLVLRAMIDFCLTNSRSSRYKHAARHLLQCSSLSNDIGDFGTFELHEAYEARLRQEHGRKQSFWNQIR